MEKLLQNTIYNFRDSIISTSLEEISSMKEEIYPPSLFILHNNIKEDSESDMSVSIYTGERTSVATISLSEEMKILATMKVNFNPTTNIMFTLHYFEGNKAKKEIYIYTKLQKFFKSFGAYVQLNSFPFKNNNKYYADIRKKNKQDSSGDKDV